MVKYRKANRWWFAALLAGFIAILDQTTKILVQNFLFENRSQPLIDKLVYLTLTKNKGIAFGLLKNWGNFFIFFSIATIILLVVFIYLYHRSLYAIFGLGLILGGTIGNLIDRVLYGSVIDFIDLRFWPVFNLADSAIVFGAIILIGGYVTYNPFWK